MRLRGALADRTQPWSIMPDLYFYRNPEEVEQTTEETEEEAGEETVKEEATEEENAASEWAEEGTEADAVAW